jgi:DNA-binding transcriptional regulator YiaG
MPRKAPLKKTAFGADLIEGMRLVLAHQRAEIELEQVWPKPVDVKAIRKGVRMSQAEFSRAYRIGKRALQEWEQGGSSARFGRARVSHCHSERTRRGAPGARQRITGRVAHWRRTNWWARQDSNL